MPQRWRSNQKQDALPVEEARTWGGFDPTEIDNQTSRQEKVISKDAEKARSKRSFSRTRADVDRPRTAGGAGPSTSSNELRPPPRTTSRPYASEAQRPPVQRLDLKTTYCMDEDMIGMALGSPSHPPFVQSNLHGQIEPAAVDAGAQSHPEGAVGAKSTNAKTGKWRKFGGLFKSKHNPSTQAPPLVLQPLEQQFTGYGTSAIGANPQPLPKDTPKLGQTLAHQEPTPMDTAQTEGVTHSAPPTRHTHMQKLEVDIPDLQMDRYSVMFGNLLDNQKPTNLLSRRSKVLERLKTTSDEDVVSHDPLPKQIHPSDPGQPSNMPFSEDDESLKPPPSTRRATSPAPGKSPIFSLFPQPQSTPKRAAAMPSQARSIPLQRSFTAPSRSSPMEETFGTKTPQVIKPNPVKRRKSSISLVETSASTMQGPGWSTDGSYLSPNSSVSSVGDEILFDIKKLSIVTENHEPQYEVTKPDGETAELYRALSKRAKAAKPPVLKPASNYAKVEATKLSVPKANEGMLRSSDTVGRSTVESSNDIPPNAADSLSEGYILPSTHFVPTAQLVDGAKEYPNPDIKLGVAPESQPLNEVNERPPPAPQLTLIPATKSFIQGKDRPALQPSQAMMPISESPIETEESGEANQDILAAAVMGTLDHMGEQSSLRAASPMPPESPELRAATPVEKPVKLLVIPKNIPISKYSLRSPNASHFKADLSTRSPSPQPRRAVTDPLVHDHSFAGRTTRLQAPPAVPNSPAKKNSTKPNSSSKVVHAPSKGNSKIREPKPALSIVAPKPAAQIDNPNSAVSPGIVTVARQVSLSRKQSKRLLIPPPGRRIEGLATDDGEKVNDTHALMPVIVDANKSHRPGKSLALVIENA